MTLSAPDRLRNLSQRYGTGFSAARIPADDLIVRSLYWHRAKAEAAKERDRYWRDDANFGGFEDVRAGAETEQLVAVMRYLKFRRARRKLARLAMSVLAGTAPTVTAVREVA